MKKTFFVLFGIFIIGFILRTYRLWDNVIFSYDQARDAQRVYDLLYQGDFKLVGPESDIPGVFNGPLFYYLIAPFYYLFNLDPNFVALFLVFLNLTGMLLLYKLALILFDNKKIGYLASFLWAISFEQANFSKYISNSSLMSISVIIFFLGLALYLFKKNNVGITISIVGLAAGIHFNVYLSYLFLVYFLFYFVFFPKINVKVLLLNLSLFLFLLSPFLISEVKWNFSATKALISYASEQSKFNGVVESISLYSQRLSETLYFSFFSINNFLALMLFIFLSVRVYRQKESRNNLFFLFIWLFSTLPLFGFRSGVLNVPIINSSIFGATTLLVAKGLHSLLTEKKYAVIGYFCIIAIFLSNINLYIQDDFANIKILPGKPMLIKHEKAVMDYTYASSKGSDFSICTVTEPLFINTLWSYLYKWYGMNEYGKLPYWAGPRQYLNRNNLSEDENHVPTRFLILENQGGIPEHMRQSTIFVEDSHSILLEQKQFGDIVVQKRKLEKDPKKLKDTQNLSLEKTLDLGRVTTADGRFSCYQEFQ